jgi:predicted Zn-dependent protease
MAEMKLGRWRAAAEQMKACLARRNQPSLTTIHPEIRTVVPQHCLAVALTHARDFNAAEAAFQDALREAPNFVPVHLDYSEAMISQGRDVEALQYVHQLAAAHAGDPTVWERGGQIALSQPAFLEVALDWTEAACAQHPAHPALVLQRAEALLLAGRLKESAPLWQEFASESTPSHLAALVVCEILGGTRGAPVEPSMQALVARDVMKWISRLVQFGAEAMVRLLEERTEMLRHRCPAAAEQLERVFAEADAA